MYLSFVTKEECECQCQPNGEHLLDEHGDARLFHGSGYPFPRLGNVELLSNIERESGVGLRLIPLSTGVGRVGALVVGSAARVIINSFIKRTAHHGLESLGITWDHFGRQSGESQTSRLSQ